MKKVKNIYYGTDGLDVEEVGRYFSGLMLELEDDTKVYIQSTDIVGNKINRIRNVVEK